MLFQNYPSHGNMIPLNKFTTKLCLHCTHGSKKKYDFVVQCTTKLCFYCLLGGEKVEQQKYDFVIHWRYNYVVYFNGVIFWLLNFFPKVSTTIYRALRQQIIHTVDKKIKPNQSFIKSFSNTDKKNTNGSATHSHWSLMPPSSSSPTTSFWPRLRPS